MPTQARQADRLVLRGTSVGAAVSEEHRDNVCMAVFRREP
jgi:hypothetical protein